MTLATRVSEVSAEWLSTSGDSCANDPSCHQIGIEWIEEFPYVVYVCDDNGQEVVRWYRIE